MRPGPKSVGGGVERRLLAPAGLTHPRGLFGRHHVAEGAERERSVRAALPMGSEEPLLLAVPVRPTRESVEYAVQPLLRTALAIVRVDRAGELARAHLLPGALREIVQGGSQRGPTLAVCAGDLLPRPLRPLHSRSPLLVPRLPVSALQRWVFSAPYSHAGAAYTACREQPILQMSDLFLA